jgi:polyhydroxybutyrate depolymerase
MHFLKLSHNEIERTYYLYIPDSYNKDNKVPLVIMFHGGGGTAKWGIEMSEWHIKANQEGFLVAFPNSTPPDTTKPHHPKENPQRWNDGSAYIKYLKITADDIGFIDALIDSISSNYAVDADRVYTTGFSNGGAMALTATMELSDKIAAVASVSGVLNIKTENKNLKKPVSMLFIVGTADPANPWDGGARAPTHIKIPEIKREPIVFNTIKWSELNNAEVKPEVVNENDGVKITRYSKLEAGAEVFFCAVEGMGHSWPGGKAHLPAEQWGQPSDKLKATDYIWEFFKNHPAGR